MHLPDPRASSSHHHTSSHWTSHRASPPYASSTRLSSPTDACHPVRAVAVTRSPSPVPDPRPRSSVARARHRHPHHPIWSPDPSSSVIVVARHPVRLSPPSSPLLSSASPVAPTHIITRTIVIIILKPDTCHSSPSSYIVPDARASSGTRRARTRHHPSVITVAPASRLSPGAPTVIT